MRGNGLSRFDLLCLGTNAIVGSGIYLLPGILAEKLGPASIFTFIICSIISAFIALCFAELSSLFQQSGGPYIYSRVAFGRWFGYWVGWVSWITSIVSWAAVTRGLIDYMGEFAPTLKTNFGVSIYEWIGSAIIITLGVINYFGIKPGAWLTDLFTILKLIPLFILTTVGLFHFNLDYFSPFLPHGLAQLPSATFVAFFAFQGFEMVPVPAGETHNPQKNVPIGILGALGLSTILYMAIQSAALGTTPNIAGSKKPLTLMAETLLGSNGAYLTSLAAMISMLGFCVGSALGAPRFLAALSASDGHLPTTFSQHHPRWQTPSKAIIATTAIAFILMWVMKFGELLDLSVTTTSIQYVATCAAVLVLRKKMQSSYQESTVFKVPGGNIIPILGVFTTSALLILQFENSDQFIKTLQALGILSIVGIAIPLVLSRIKRTA